MTPTTAAVLTYVSEGGAMNYKWINEINKFTFISKKTFYLVIFFYTLVAKVLK